MIYADRQDAAFTLEEGAGHVIPGPDGTLYEWWCSDCPIDGEAETYARAALGLYLHRQVHPE